MKKATYFLCSLLIGCIPNNGKIHKEQCPGLELSLATNDTIDYESDKDYGIGEDDLFSTNDFVVYERKKGMMIDVTNKINDYNLTSSYTSSLKLNNADTLDLIIDFKGLYNDPKIDTTIVITSIDIVNGNRYSINHWRNGGKAKDILVVHNNVLIGCVSLRNTYKMQSILLNGSPVVNSRGKADTISIIISSTFQDSFDKEQFAISEIKLDGYRKY